MSAKRKEIFGPVPVTLHHRAWLEQKNKEKPLCELVRRNINYGFDPVLIPSNIAADLDTKTDTLTVTGDIFVPKGFDRILIKLASSQLQLSYLELALSITGVSFSGEDIEFLANPTGGFPVINPDLLARFDDHSEPKAGIRLPFVFNLKLQQACQRLQIRLRSEEGYLFRLQIIAKDSNGGSHVAHDITQAPSTNKQTQPENERVARKGPSMPQKRSRSSSPMDITQTSPRLPGATYSEFSEKLEKPEPRGPKRQKVLDGEAANRRESPVEAPNTIYDFVQDAGPASQEGSKAIPAAKLDAISHVPLIENIQMHPGSYHGARLQVWPREEHPGVPSTSARYNEIKRNRWPLSSDSGYSSQSSGSSFQNTSNAVLPQREPPHEKISQEQLAVGVCSSQGIGIGTKGIQQEDSLRPVDCICGKHYLGHEIAGKHQDMLDDIIRCDRCNSWQHAKCVGITSERTPGEYYFCRKCQPHVGAEDKSSHVHFDVPAVERLENISSTSGTKAISQDKALSLEESEPINTQVASGPENVADHDAVIDRYEVSVSLVARCKNLGRRLLRERVKDTHQRLEWICGCGKSLHVDMKKRSQAEIARLAALLQCSPNPGFFSNSSMNNLPPHRPPPVVITGQGSSFSSSPSSSSLGSLSAASLASSMSSAYSASTPPIPNQSYLELYINTGEYTKTLPTKAGN